VTVRVPRKLLRPVPWFVSLVAHVSLVAVMWLLSNGLPARTPSAYDQLLKGKEAQIVFYKFKDKLPDVQPVRSADARPPKAEIRIPKQSIVSSPKNSVKATQMILQPAPDILPKEVPSPNILAIKAPPIAAPVKPKFVPPAPQAKAERAAAQPKLPDAPAQIALNSRLPDQLGALPKLSLENRPRLVAPEARARRTAQPQEAGAAPAMASAPASASPLAGLQASELNVAVIGLNPSEKNAIPQGSRAAEFSAGPVVRPDGGTGAQGKGVALPDLYVSGGGAEAKPTLMARLNAAPTSVEALRGMSKYAAPAPEGAGTGATPPRIGAARVSSAPNPRFDGKEVYTLAIQMPNITSYIGSWLMWYSGRDPGTGPVVAPVPHRKVDPKYIAQAAEERVEGKVQLLCVIRRTGDVDHIELVRGIDDRLNQSAMEALAKWKFTPASRGGEPVDVDVLVEIPFRLAPRIAK
jgi:TonB family protein